ncbi:MAG: glycosyltransferase family 4 protein [Candidatus Saccharimonadales bacterium]
MKIGVLIDRLNVGGVEKIAIEEVKALIKAGLDASLVVLREKAVVENAFPDLLEGVPIVYLDRRLPKFLRLSFRFPVFSFFSSFHITYPLLLPFVLKRHEFDYFIVHGTYTSLSAIAFKKRRGINFSAFVWDPVSYILERVYTGKFITPVSWILRRIAVAFDKHIIKHMDVILVGGDAHNNYLHALNPLKKIEVIYPSVHPSLKLSKKKDYILMVTAWKDGKNPEYLVEISKILPNSHIKMVGKWVDPSYQQTFELLLKKNLLNETIEVVGAVDETELANYYAQARVVLQTNDDRGFGLPALEAAGHGTTFVIPEGQGVCSLFVNEIDGYYTKEKDTKEITARLELLLSNTQLATKMGKHAWKKVKDSYSWEIHAKKLESIVSEALRTNS